MAELHPYISLFMTSMYVCFERIMQLRVCIYSVMITLRLPCNIYIMFCMIILAIYNFTFYFTTQYLSNI